MNIKLIKQAQKKSPDELQEYLQFKRRGSTVKAKKGKGAYNRKTKCSDCIEDEVHQD